MKLRIAGVTKESVVDGPGIRLVIFAQGCPHRCSGCHNPETHVSDGGIETTVTELAKMIKQVKLIRGVTFSGGEPLMQPQAFARLAEIIKAAGYDLVVYSGYKFEEIMEMAAVNKYISTLIKHTDILVDGPYIAELRDLRLAFRGSVNQRLIDVPKSISVGLPVIAEIEQQRP